MFETVPVIQICRSSTSRETKLKKLLKLPKLYFSIIYKTTDSIAVDNWVAIVPEHEQTTYRKVHTAAKIYEFVILTSYCSKHCIAIKNY